MPGSDLYLHRNTCTLTALVLSPSVLFQFIFFLSENHLKTILTRLPQKLQTLVLCSGNTSLTFKWLGIQYWDYTKRNTETDSGSERLRLTQVLLKTQNRADSGQENKLQNGSRNIYDHSPPPPPHFPIFVCWKFKHPKYTQMLWVNRFVHSFYWNTATSWCFCDTHDTDGAHFPSTHRPSNALLILPFNVVLLLFCTGFQNDVVSNRTKESHQSER